MSIRGGGEAKIDEEKIGVLIFLPGTCADIPQISLYNSSILSFPEATLTDVLSGPAGRVPSLHRGAAAVRQVVRLHLVQPAGGQEEVLQEAREEDVSGGGEAVQGGADGESGSVPQRDKD